MKILVNFTRIKSRAGTPGIKLCKTSFPSAFAWDQRWPFSSGEVLALFLFRWGSLIHRCSTQSLLLVWSLLQQGNYKHISSKCVPCRHVFTQLHWKQRVNLEMHCTQPAQTRLSKILTGQGVSETNSVNTHFPLANTEKFRLCNQPSPTSSMI